MIAAELKDGAHQLVLELSAEHDERAATGVARIHAFAVNGSR
jgi:hypothetical protein